MRRVLLLLGGGLAFWLVAALPFRFLDNDPARGTAAVAYAGTALLLCLVPAALTLWWGGRALSQPADQQLVAVLGGTGVRLFTVVVVGWLLFSWVPYYQTYPGFLAWLVAAYLFTLGLEMTLLLAGRPPQRQEPAAPARE